MDSTWLTTLLHASDSLYPTGSYAHSFGLEGLVIEGVVRDQVTLGEFIKYSLVPSLAAVDLPLCAHAWHALESEPNWNQVESICELASAVRPAREPREACERIGRARLDLLLKLRPCALAETFARHVSEKQWQTPSPVIAALEARCAGAPMDVALAAVAYAPISGVLSAAVKLLRMGQIACHTLLTEALAMCTAQFPKASALPLNAIGFFQPWWDIAAARHENADGRLFIS